MLRTGKINKRGFTLIELMVVAAIVSILAAIAYPSYTRYVQNSRQAEVQGEMMTLAGALERYRAKNFTYDGATLANLSPGLANSEFYTVTLSISGTGNQQYLISATPKSGLMSDTDFMALDSEGRACKDASSCTPSSSTHW